MPSINLRLTDQQHAELERWAHEGYRSIQKEIIFRLFSNQLETDVPEAIVGAIVPGLEVRRTAPPPPEHFKPTFPQKSFRPDPKPERKK